MTWVFKIENISYGGKCISCEYSLKDLKLDKDSVGKLKGLTIDKTYTVTGIDNIGFRIIDDEFRNYWYTKELFYPIEDIRDNKLNKILENEK